MRCPQCDAEAPDDAWNCPACRVNLYWAHQHSAELAHIREQQGLDGHPSTPSFLVAAHKRSLDDRATRGGSAMNKVRTIARRVIRGESVEQP